MNIKLFAKNRRFGRFGKLSLVVTAALLVCAGAANAQTERRVPEAIAGEEALAQPSPNYPAQCPTQEIWAGHRDDFSPNGVELTAPSATLQNWIAPPYAQFDGTEIDKRVIHTFRLPPCKCLVGAKLELLAKALGSCSPYSSANDSVNLGFSTLSPVPYWSARLGGSSAPPALSTPCWGSSPLVRSFTLDLAALPVVPAGTISLLSAMQTNKYLDFYVQDDTAIDYIKLTATMCDCCQPNGKAEICISKFYDKNRNGVKDTTEPGLPGWMFQANDQAGGNLVTSPPTTAAGAICFSVLAPATYAISEVPKAGWIQTTPVNPANPLVTVTPGGAVVNLAFGNWHKKFFDDEPNESKDPH
jgi:SdrD B-like domain